MKILPSLLLLSITVLSACSSPPPMVSAFNLSEQQPVGSSFMRVTFLGTLDIPALTVDGHTVHELSDLAWDQDDQVLYAVSDQGVLFHLQPKFDTSGNLIDVSFLSAYSLQIEQHDAEGLSLVKGDNGVQGDAELIISFERDPRIARVTPVGEWLADEVLPLPLQNADNYQSSNKMLEAVTLHPYFGLLTMPELPLNNTPDNQVTLYGPEQQTWFWPPNPAPRSSVVALENIDNTSILVLERAFQDPMQPLIISLRQVWLSTCECNNGVESVYLPLAEFNSSQGWMIDNFEGLTRHKGNRYFMVSDDNGHQMQRTLLVYFEILPNM